ncbi:CamS family sex pheromone protein [Sporosarcina trichiuri]|uniref:CamS family sex pheromone protein n=1 Tax=Sporosarcina trichiuri TaxID=3056445 RepID=UPI0025B36FC0|nr:CamS family sex pheromone protein [Sporosarcina sp. 0.2-SM1T-5]WJY27405.1 CamS family sex pheromone protein [Sporosarcina sp. 0.2-SM1T-5]
MKRLFTLPAFAAVLVLGGCIPSIGPEKEEVIQENEDVEQETVLIPEVQLNEQYYRTLLPFKKSATRGLIVNQVYSKYDIEEVEEGLLRLSAKHFDPNDHFFQEGQFIDEKTAIHWLSRSSKFDDGLNPPINDKMTPQEISEKAPVYLAHIVEQNYYVKTGDKKVGLAGISIGLAMNSVYYQRDAAEAKIPDKTIEQQGMKMAETIVQRMRKLDGVGDVPITVGLFKQQSRNSIVPGTYFAQAYVDKGKDKPNGWKEVKEKFVLLPASSDVDNYRDVNERFEKVKQDINDYFPGFISVVGTAFYSDNNLESIKINVPIQFYGKNEVVALTQYMTSLIMKYYPKTEVEVSITSGNGPESLITKNAGDEEPSIHIYSY